MREYFTVNKKIFFRPACPDRINHNHNRYNHCQIRAIRCGGVIMNSALESIGILLQNIFGPEGAALLVDDLRIALAAAEADCAHEGRAPGRETPAGLNSSGFQGPFR